MLTMLAEWSGHGWGGPWFLVFPLIWVALIVGLVLWLRRGHAHDHMGSGESVLDERFARGEITEEEYRQRASVLRERKR